MSTLVTRQRSSMPHLAVPDVARQLLWYGAGAALAFGVPYLFTSVLDTPHDLYYLAYFGAMGGFLTAYIKATRADVIGLFRRGWKLSLALGALTTAFTVFNVLNRDATPRPDGAYFAFEALWRGLTYGVVDALVLTAFPVLVARGLLGGKLAGWQRRVGFAALTLALMWGITATYHLGYAQYRADGVREPELGNTVITVPAIVTGNPLGSVVTHAAMHLTAVTHAYETDVFLPPQTDAR